MYMWSHSHATALCMCRDEVAQSARKLGLSVYIVSDAGRTQIAAGSRTVLSVGPGTVQHWQRLVEEIVMVYAFFPQGKLKTLIK